MVAAGAAPPALLMHLDDDLDRIVDALARIFDRGGDVCQRKGMRMDELRIKALLLHERARAMSGTLAFAANAEHVNVVAHEVRDIDKRRLMRKRREANAPAAVEHARGLVNRV